MIAEEPPRLFSKQARVPVDVVERQHQDIHADLERWGRWNRARMHARGCGSMEGVYEKYATPAATGVELDLRSIAIERAVLHMPVQQRETTRLYYVQGCSPNGICRIFTLRFEAFPRWMHTCRAMVCNLLRRQGN